MMIWPWADELTGLCTRVESVIIALAKNTLTAERVNLDCEMARSPPSWPSIPESTAVTPVNCNDVLTPSWLTGELRRTTSETVYGTPTGFCSCSRIPVPQFSIVPLRTVLPPSERKSVCTPTPGSAADQAVAAQIQGDVRAENDAVTGRAVEVRGQGHVRGHGAATCHHRRSCRRGPAQRDRDQQSRRSNAGSKCSVDRPRCMQLLLWNLRQRHGAFHPRGLTSAGEVWVNRPDGLEARRPVAARDDCSSRA